MFLFQYAIFWQVVNNIIRAIFIIPKTLYILDQDIENQM